MHIRIKEARERAQLTPEQLAEKMKVSKEAVRLWEAGSGPKRVRVPELAAKLGVSPEWLLTGRDKDAALPSSEALEWAKKWERLSPAAQEFLGAQIEAYLRLAARNPVLGEIMSRAPKGKAQRDFENHLAKYGTKEAKETKG